MEVEVRNLTKIFGTLRANDGISLRFAGGQIHGVLGENGAGKSTLMKLLSGFLQRDAGEILIDGRLVDIRNPRDAIRAGVGMVHQDPLDIPAFTALENFACAAPPGKLTTRRMARQQLVELNQHLGFSINPETLLSAMTVGQRQQLEIMRQLTCGARVLILDEPTTGITAAQKVALFAAVKLLAQDGATILFVSHKLDEVSELCDTVSVLRAGRLVAPQLPMPVPQEQILQLMFGSTSDHHQAHPDPVEIPGASLLPPVWELQQVTVREGRTELHGLNLAIQPGQVLGLAGLDGSGQQQLLRLLAGRLQPTAGRRRLNGVDTTTAPYHTLREAGVHYLPADRMADGVVGPLSLAAHLALQHKTGLLLDEAQAQAAARAAIDAYEIKATPNTPIVALSGGNQQRVMLALLPPRCVGVLMDQPTRGLDVASARAVWEKLLSRRSAGTAIVFASADLDEILEYSDQVLVFFGGLVSSPLPRTSLTETRLAELIGGVGFEAMHE